MPLIRWVKRFISLNGVRKLRILAKDMLDTDNQERILTGIRGLDHILRGGLPKNRLYLIEGDPGTGKTTIGLQFLMAGAQAGERCLYITLSESEEEIVSVARSHGWSLDGITIQDPTI